MKDLWRPMVDVPRDGSAFLGFGIHTHSPPDAQRGIVAGDTWFAIILFDVWRGAQSVHGRTSGFVFAKDGMPVWSEPQQWQPLIGPEGSTAELPMMEGHGSQALSCWFNLSYAAFLTLPRVLMEAMPDAWQGRMAALLDQYDAAFPNRLSIGTRVQATEKPDGSGRLTTFPAWVLNYRRPDREAISRARGEEAR